jgi:hypothetical protein
MLSVESKKLSIVSRCEKERRKNVIFNLQFRPGRVKFAVKMSARSMRRPAIEFSQYALRRAVVIYDSFSFHFLDIHLAKIPLGVTFTQKIVSS